MCVFICVYRAPNPRTVGGDGHSPSLTPLRLRAPPAQLEITVADLLRVYLKGKHPLKTDDFVNRLLARTMQRTLSEDMWADIVQYMCVFVAAHVLPAFRAFARFFLIAPAHTPFPSTSLLLPVSFPRFLVHVRLCAEYRYNEPDAVKLGALVKEAIRALPAPAPEPAVLGRARAYKAPIAAVAEIGYAAFVAILLDFQVRRFSHHLTIALPALDHWSCSLSNPSLPPSLTICARPHACHLYTMPCHLRAAPRPRRISRQVPGPVPADRRRGKGVFGRERVQAAGGER